MTDYERGFQDGQQDRRRDDQRSDYLRGYRDGYGGWRYPQVIPAHPFPYFPINPYVPTWSDSGTFRVDHASTTSICATN